MASGLHKLLDSVDRSVIVALSAWPLGANELVLCMCVCVCVRARAYIISSILLQHLGASLPVSEEVVKAIKAVDEIVNSLL